MAQLKIGVLGYGSIGKRHAINAEALGHDVLIYDPPLPEHCAREYLIQHSDAIIIATPTDQHWVDTLDCCEAKKPMLIEKPIVHPCRKTLDLVADALATSSVPAFMGFNLRFHSVARKAKEWLPRIGTPQDAKFVILQKNERPDYLRDGVISNWLSHELDLALHLLGPAQLKSCTVDAADTNASLVIQHDTCASRLTGNYLTDPEVRSFCIYGELGQIVANLAPRNAFLYLNGKCVDEYRPDDTFDQNYLDELSSFIDQIQGKPGLCATWEDGVNVERIVIAARELGGLQ